MTPTLKFRHRIALLVALAAVALIALAAVTLVLGRRNKEQLTGIETHYVPLIELDRDLEAQLAKVTRALEDAAEAAEQSKVDEADELARELRERVTAGARTIADNGGDPAALLAAFARYYTGARDVSASLVAGVSPDELSGAIEAMSGARAALEQDLDRATRPDRVRLSAAFARARATQNESLWIDVAVAVVVLTLMGFLSWRIIRRTVGALTAVSVGVERLARGEFSQQIDFPPGDELGDLAREANRTAVALSEHRERSEREAWIKTGLTELADRIVGELDPEALAAKAMDHLVRWVEARGAVAYALDDDDRDDDDGDDDGALVQVAAIGDVGAAPPDRRAVDDLPLDRGVRVAPSAGGHTIVVPLVHDHRVVAVIELVTAGAPKPRALELLGRVRTVLGAAFRVAEARQREGKLLAETQRQALEVRTANKELEAFSYSVSHDLRSPLRSIDGFSQALLEDYADKLDATGQDYLNRVRAAAQRMAELIDDMLRLSRVSRADFRREQVDLSAIAAAIARDLQRADPERAVELRFQPEVIAAADARLIRITLENLLGNAWKFSAKKAGAVIEFGVEHGGDEPVYFVRDNGAGFDMKYAERLFGAFQRLHSEREFSGTGIGLATVQRIIHRHGGRIWVEAAVNRGATFRFTLPGEPPGARS